MSVSASETLDFDYLTTLIYERSRIRLHEGKRPLIQARLAKRVRHHGFASLSQYCEYLRRSGDESELTQVVDALTTNYTQFFREGDHFDFLGQQALPGLLEANQKRFRIWSSACATGEEPYSLAIYLSEHYPVSEGWDWQILATDISTKALDKATQGIYSNERIVTIPPEWLRRYFQKGERTWIGHYRVKAHLRERIQFAQLNLLSDYPFHDLFEVIFCRNVMIYFDRPTQQQLVRQLHRFLVPKGILLTGHSESLNGFDAPFRCLRPSVYQKL